MERKQTREQGNAKKCEKRRPLHRSFFCTNERTPLAAFWRLFFLVKSFFFSAPFRSQKNLRSVLSDRDCAVTQRSYTRAVVSLFLFTHSSLALLVEHAHVRTHTHAHTQKKQTRAHHRERRGESKRDASRRTFVSERIKRTQRAQRSARRRKRSRKDFL